MSKVVSMFCISCNYVFLCRKKGSRLKRVTHVSAHPAEVIRSKLPFLPFLHSDIRRVHAFSRTDDERRLSEKKSTGPPTERRKIPLSLFSLSLSLGLSWVVMSHSTAVSPCRCLHPKYSSASTVDANPQIRGISRQCLHFLPGGGQIFVFG